MRANRRHNRLAFYREVPLIREFHDVGNPKFYRSVPEDWCVVITDVVNSTEAIEDGRYKEVNTAGAIAGMAVANLTGGLEFPFVFGGDGFTYVLPSEGIEDVKSVLADTRELVATNFNLDLRVGVVSVAELYARGADLRIGRLQVSEKYTQAIFDGTGLAFADDLVKGVAPPLPGVRYNLPPDFPVSRGANFNGFSCRWKDIPSARGETASIIVSVRDVENRGSVLTRVLSDVEEVLGDVATYHPLREETQSPETEFRSVHREATVHSRRRSGVLNFLHRVSIRLQIAAVSAARRYRLPLRFAKKKLKDVALDNILSSDFRKFDGTLKMVISCTTEDRIKLVERLDTYQGDGLIDYGLHVADRAVMTCLIHGAGREVHFIDAADGGYALAAKTLKQRRRARAS